MLSVAFIQLYGFSLPAGNNGFDVTIWAERIVPRTAPDGLLFMPGIFPGSHSLEMARLSAMAWACPCLGHNNRGQVQDVKLRKGTSKGRSEAAMPGVRIHDGHLKRKGFPKSALL